MPDYYVADISLECDAIPQDRIEMAMLEFTRIWPSHSATLWQGIQIMTDNPVTLLDRLNGEFTANLQYRSPYPAKSSWVITAPFAGIWKIGSGGIHIIGNNITYRVGGGAVQPWRFSYGPMQEYESEVTVKATWKRVRVL